MAHQGIVCQTAKMQGFNLAIRQHRNLASRLRLGPVDQRASSVQPCGAPAVHRSLARQLRFDEWTANTISGWRAHPRKY
jgi:hypothetical protein